MYFLVFSEKSSGIIPKSWLDEKSKSFKWPKTKNPALLIMKAEPPKDSWLSYRYNRIFGPYESYDEARQFELDTLNLSTNDDDGFAAVQNKKKLTEITERTKRRCEKPIRYRSKTSDEEHEMVKLKTTKTTKKKPRVLTSSSSENEGTDNDLPTPPTNYVRQKNAAEPLETLKENISDHTSTTSSPVRSLSKTFTRIPLSPKVIINHKKIHDVSLSSPELTPPKLVSPLKIKDSKKSDDIDKKYAESDLINSLDDIENQFQDINDSEKISSKPKIRSIIKSNIPIRSGKIDFRELNKTVKQQLDNSHTYKESEVNKEALLPETVVSEIGCHGHSCCQKIFGELKSLRTLVSSIYLTLRDENNVAKTSKRIDFGLPIETSKQLTTFDSKLQNAVAAAQYQQIVKQIGGLNFEKHVRNALVLTLSDTIAYRMSWTGAKNTIMVKDMIFTKLITDAVMEKFNTTADITKIHAVIKSWLQHAGDRLKGRDK